MGDTTQRRGRIVDRSYAQWLAEEAGYSPERAAEISGYAVDQIRAYWRAFGIISVAEARDTLIDQVIPLLRRRRGANPAEIAAKLQITVQQATSLIDQMQDAGHDIVRTPDGAFHIVTRSTPPADEPFPIEEAGGDVVTFGVVGDTHLGTKEEYLAFDFLRRAYEEFERAGCCCVLHAGDITDGAGRHRHPSPHEVEPACFTIEGIVSYTAANYPASSLRTYFISGNHDLWAKKDTGMDYSEQIAARRPDLVYLGAQRRTVAMGPNWQTRIALYHPDGTVSRSSVARRLEQVINALAPTGRPHLLIMGHYHFPAYTYTYHTHCLLTPATQYQTSFLRGKNVTPFIGAWILSLRLAPTGDILAIEQMRLLQE